MDVSLLIYSHIVENFDFFKHVPTITANAAANIYV